MPVASHREDPARAVAAVERADDRTLRWLAQTDHGPLRPVLRGAARAADLLAPFVAISAWSGAKGTSEERTAVARGWVAMATAAVIANGMVKPIVDRGRPDARRLPPGQRRRTSPSTSAFPSGHIAATTAFSTAAGRGQPSLRPWLIASTLMVAYTNLYTGRHHLSDVVVGMAIGAATGRLASHLTIGPGRANVRRPVPSMTCAAN